VATSQEALQNIPVIGTLKPGETYKTRIEMASDPKGKRPITFRLGFIPNVKRPVQDAHDPTLIWSNLVTLEVATRVGSPEDDHEYLPDLTRQMNNTEHDHIRRSCPPHGGGFPSNRDTTLS
jgi:hypothetical protein